MDLWIYRACRIHPLTLHVLDDRFTHAGGDWYRRTHGAGFVYTYEVSCMKLDLMSVLSTGVDAIDHQHAELFDRVNKVFDLSGGMPHKEQLGDLIDFLGDYVVKHFKAEEELMKKSAYPGIAAHQELHRAFLGEFTKIKEEFEAKGPGLTLMRNTNKVVVEWLVKHVGIEDRRVGEHLQKKK
ncbi:MAG: hemerythrin [Alphaproteobacteria bacterium CG_4_10_14_0_2_um_filter_63_37]|nr:MAG: hemerythrin [Alphaproteobacteria bacterium CG_4_10_14_0_2_um_filter_63_37]